MKQKSKTQQRKDQLTFTLTALGLTGLVTGCNAPNPLIKQVNAQGPATSTATASPTPSPTSTASPAPTATPLATATPWPTFTPAPTATPWPAPVAWQPVALAIPTLAPLPVVPTPAAAAVGLLPVSYSPPNGVDVFGGALLRWEYFGQLAEDEWFDIKIKPAGSNDSVFVEWSKAKEYALGPWPGWRPGLYTWQIGIVKGAKAGDAKQFIADLGRDSQPSLIKWQPGGGGGGGGSNGGSGGGGGGGGSTSGGGGGGSSGGS